MSNTKTQGEIDTDMSRKVQLKVEVPLAIREHLKKVSQETGFSQAQIITMLIRTYCHALDVEHDTRRMMKEAAERNRSQFKLTKKQKQTLRENGVDGKFTKDLI